MCKLTLEILTPNTQREVWPCPQRKLLWQDPWYLPSSKVGRAAFLQGIASRKGRSYPISHICALLLIITLKTQRFMLVSSQEKKCSRLLLLFFSCMEENQHTSILNHREVVVKAEREILHRQMPHGLLQGSAASCWNTQALKMLMLRLKRSRAI